MTAEGVEPAKEGLRDRNSPMCTLSQNGYGTSFVKFDDLASLFYVAAEQMQVIHMHVTDMCVCVLDAAPQQHVPRK